MSTTKSNHGLPVFWKRARGASSVALSAALGAACLALGCTSAPRQAQVQAAGPAQPQVARAAEPGADPIARAPFEDVQPDWKHRLDQPYVFVEHQGDYRAIGSAIERLLAAVEAQRIEVDGPLFALYYDDPGAKPTAELRARACLPLAPGANPSAPLSADVLPSTTVAYCLVAGPYPEVPRVYPALLRYMRERGWELDGPVRETYLNPDAAQHGGELLTEVQMPWTPAAR